MLLSGKTGFVALAGRKYRFGKWDLPLTMNTPKANNFIDAPFSIFVGGLFEAKLTCDGPYDLGNMPLVLGNVYIFTLGWTPAVSFTVTGYLNSLNPSNDVENNPIVKIGAQVSGAFGLFIT